LSDDRACAYDTRADEDVNVELHRRPCAESRRGVANGTQAAIPGSMKSLVASIFALAALGGAAHAGTYVGLGIGTGAHTDGDLTQFDSSGSHSGRAVIGDRFGIVSVEGGLGYFGVMNSGRTYDAVSLGVAAKLSVPVTPVFEPYVRVGLEHTNLSGENGATYTASGDGWSGGLGLEYKLATLSLWADYTKHDMTLGDGRVDGAASMLTFGVSFGI
jgi:hypothetical protein